MADPAIKIGAEVYLQNTSKLERSIEQLQRKTRIGFSVDDRASLPLGRIAKSAADIDSSLDAATARVVSFGIAAGAVGAISLTFSKLAESVIEVEDALAKINVNFGATQDQLRVFSKEVFNAAINTGKTFNEAAKAAEELARQGLGVEETTKRLNNALILSRRAGIDSAEAVNTLTAAFNSYSSAGLDTTQIINKLVAVDTRFAVSTKDLSDAISRSASTAQEAGLTFDEFLGIVTSVQQTTARGGAVIGNALKTIFTRVQAAPETVSALERLGIAITDSSGAFTTAGERLRQYAQIRQTLSEGDKAYYDRIISGTQQINILTAALNDLGKANSVAAEAQRISLGATNEAIAQNEELNQTLKTIINETGQQFVQLFSNIGQELGNLTKGNLVFGVINDLLGAINASESAIKGISNVLTGPGLAAFFVLTLKAVSAVTNDLGATLFALSGIKKESQVRLQIEKQIAAVTANATSEELKRLNAATSLAERRNAYLAIEQRVTAELTRQAALSSSLAQSLIPSSPVGRIGGLGAGFSFPSREVRGLPNFADPLRTAIQREIDSGVPKSSIYVDTDPRLKSPSNPKGLLVANRIDEPLGGFQGVNNAIKQGRNPKTSGFVPNFAEFDRLEKLPTGKPLQRLDVFGNPKEVFDFIDPNDAKKLRSLFRSLRQEGQSSVEEFLKLNESLNNFVNGLDLSLGSYNAVQEKINKIASGVIAREEAKQIALQAFIAKDNERAARDVELAKIAKEQRKISEPLAYRSQDFYNYIFGGPGSSLAGKNQFTGNRPRRFPSPTFVENALERNLFNIPTNELAGVAGFSGNRVEGVRNLRKEINSFRGKNIEKSFIETVGSLATTKTFDDVFVETVQKKIKNEGLNFADAVEKTSDELKDLGISTKQLRNSIVNNAIALKSFESSVEENQRQILKQNNIALAGVRAQAVRNQGISALAKSEGDLSKLTRQQQAVLLAGLRSEAKQTLGFGGFSRTQLSGSTEAQKQIEDFVGKRLSEIQTSLRRAAQEAARVNSLGNQSQRISRINKELGDSLGGFLGTGLLGGKRNDLRAVRRAGFATEDKELIRNILAERERRRFQNRQTASFVASAALPFAAGFVGEGEGGTAGGIGRGLASGALQGGGVGALFGPVGIAVGAVAGGLVGAFSKLEKSSADLAKQFQNQSAIQIENLNNLRSYLQVQEELANAQKSGDVKLVERLGKQASNLEKFLEPSVLSSFRSGGIKSLEQSVEQRTNEQTRNEIGQSLAIALKEDVFGTSFSEERAQQLDNLAKKAAANLSKEAIQTVSGLDRRRFLSIEERGFGAGSGARGVAFDKTLKDLRSGLEPLVKEFPELAEIGAITGNNLQEVARVLGQVVDEAKRLGAAQKDNAEEQERRIKEAIKNRNRLSFADFGQEEASTLFNVGSLARGGVTNSGSINDRAILASISAIEKANLGELPKNLEGIKTSAETRLGESGIITALESLITGALGQSSQSLGFVGANGTRNPLAVLRSARNLRGVLPQSIQPQVEALLGIAEQKGMGSPLLPTSRSGVQAFAPGSSPFNPANTIFFGNQPLPTQRVNPGNTIIPGGGNLLPTEANRLSPGSSISVNGQKLPIATIPPPSVVEPPKNLPPVDPTALLMAKTAESLTKVAEQFAKTPTEIEKSVVVLREVFSKGLKVELIQEVVNKLFIDEEFLNSVNNPEQLKKALEDAIKRLETVEKAAGVVRPPAKQTLGAGGLPNLSAF